MTCSLFLCHRQLRVSKLTLGRLDEEKATQQIPKDVDVFQLHLTKTLSLGIWLQCLF
jgi:hypothetical protein